MNETNEGQIVPSVRMTPIMDRQVLVSGLSARQLSDALALGLTPPPASRPLTSAATSRTTSARTALYAEHRLTRREAEMLELITEGLRNQEIAARCYLSINSVKTHVRNAYAKIGVASRSQAVLWGVRHGLDRPEA